MGDSGDGGGACVEENLKQCGMEAARARLHASSEEELIMFSSCADTEGRVRNEGFVRGKGASKEGEVSHWPKPNETLCVVPPGQSVNWQSAKPVAA